MVFSYLLFYALILLLLLKYPKTFKTLSDVYSSFQPKKHLTKKSLCSKIKDNRADVESIKPYTIFQVRECANIRGLFLYTIAFPSEPLISIYNYITHICSCQVSAPNSRHYIYFVRDLQTLMKILSTLRIDIYTLHLIGELD